jgi:hypothetical protein
MSILFLFRRIDAMRSGIHSQRVNATLHRHVGQPPVVVRIVFLNDGNRTA